jgi:anti-repressor protein
MTTVSQFSIEVARDLFQLSKNGEAFPVDFESAWVWLGYSNKANAKASLLHWGFNATSDFNVIFENEVRLEGVRQTKPSFT